MTKVLIYHGNCLTVLRKLDDDSVDSIVTDPPYDLTSGKNGGTGMTSLNTKSPAGRSRIGTGGGFMGQSWDATGIAFRPGTWRECLRVLKPGGHMLVFGGTRTWHRLACAVEDSGFEIRDTIAWLYGSGFPKSLDVSKAIDKSVGAQRKVVGYHAKPATALYMNAMPMDCEITAPATDVARQWQGWGTALKPAFEPIIVARKPLSGTVAHNMTTHGTGALNIDGCRVNLNGDYKSKPNGRPSLTGLGDNYDPKVANQPDTQGRWPPNVTMDPDIAAELDEQSGISKDGVAIRHRGVNSGTVYGNSIGHLPMGTPDMGYGGYGGASRFFPVFRYQAKAPSAERPSVNGTSHPTVKPLELMRWLVRLVTPPGGMVLDPFAGSGTTGEACILEGLGCTMIEKQAEYIDLIKARIGKYDTRWRQ